MRRLRCGDVQWMSLKSHSVVSVHTGTWMSAAWPGILLTCHCWLSVVVLLVFLIRTFVCSWMQQDLIPFASPASSTFLEIVKGVKVGRSVPSDFFSFIFFQWLYIKSPSRARLHAMCFMPITFPQPLQHWEVQRLFALHRWGIWNSELKSLLRLLAGDRGTQENSPGLSDPIAHPSAASTAS